MTRARHRLIVVCAVALSVLPARGYAQASDQAQQTNPLIAAQRQHHAAVRAFALGNYRQAIELFSAADKQLPNAAYSFNIARAYEALGDASHALGFYRDYLRRAGSPPDTTQVNQRIQALSARLADQSVQRDKLAGPPTRAPASRARVPAGLSPAAPAVPPTALSAPRSNATPTPEPAPGADLRTAGFVTLGAGAAALGVGMIFEIMRANTESAATREAEQTRFAEELDSMRSQQTAARVFAGAGIALAAAGGVLLTAGILVSKHESRERLAVACQPAACHASFAGVF
jgi:tetratricopeptide (TPR) repeat protein